jgi:iron complex transport system substrate-binding protein
LLIAGGILLVAAATFASTEDEKSGMTRRQQGILTGMPFMAHVSARAYVDDAGRRTYFAKPPARIVSLAPSITEMLFVIEAGEQLVGVTDLRLSA